MTQIRVYGADLCRLTAEDCYPILDSSEAERAASISHLLVREEFVKTRALLRTVLGAYTDRSPRDFTFTTGVNGKPRLVGDDQIHFNVSHAAGRALIAIAPGAVGIDIERADKSINHLAVAAEIFSPEEYAAVERAPRLDRSEIFFTIWTRKEAYLKATGCGFSANLERISSMTPDREIEDTSMPQGSEHWFAYDLPAPEFFRAALVTSSDSLEISMSDVSGILQAH